MTKRLRGKSYELTVGSDAGGAVVAQRVRVDLREGAVDEALVNGHLHRALRVVHGRQVRQAALLHLVDAIE